MVEDDNEDEDVVDEINEVLHDKDDEELESIIEDFVENTIPAHSGFSELIVPSLDRTRIIETSLERGVRDVEVEEDDWHSEYGAKDDYVAGKEYDDVGGGDYESEVEVNIDSRREVSLPMGGGIQSTGSNITSGGKGYPGFKRDGKKYHSALEQGSKDEEEKKKKEKRMW